MSRKDQRRTSDFSIARILAKEDDPKQEDSKNNLEWFSNFCKLQNRPETVKPENGDQPAHTDTREQKFDTSEKFKNADLSWLTCTRYSPPKLPRKSYAGKNKKRKPGSHPRIPFTKQQLDILEEKYKINAYLMKKDIVHLSELLNLHQDRIKIWFQNRRARQRRESLLLQQNDTTRN